MSYHSINESRITQETQSLLQHRQPPLKMRVKMPWHNNPSSSVVGRDIQLVGNDCEYIFGTWMAQAGKARAHRGYNRQIGHSITKMGIETPIIRSPPDRALWPKATYSPHSPRSPSPPVCFLCSGYLADKNSYTICSACEARYAMPLYCFGKEDEYGDFFAASPSLQCNSSDSPILLVEESIAAWRKSCSTNSVDKYVTPVLSCSSSVYSQDKFDIDEYPGSLTVTSMARLENSLTSSGNSCIIPTLSSSSSVYSQDEHEEERAEKDTRGYYELPWIADYFSERQHSIYKELDESVEEDCSIEISILYK